MSQKQTRVLMTGAGAPGAAGIIKCLTSVSWIELIVADANEQAVGRYIHQHFVSLPKASDPYFIPALKEICITKGIQVVMPLVTKELLPLSLAREEFLEIGVQLLVSSAESLRLANNKSACYRFLKEKSIRLPDFFVVTTTEQFIHAAFKLGYPSKPFCFKPSESNGSRGFRIVSDSINESDLLFNQKPYNTYITYSHALRILSAQPFPELLVSDYLPGDEYSVDCLAQNGEAKLIVPRKRIKMNNGISIEGVFEEKREIQAYCRQIISVLQLHGNIGIQVKYAGDGLPYLLEINPRVQGTIVAALGAGVNLPLLAVEQALGKDVGQEQVQIKWNTGFSRHWTEVFY